MNRLHEILTLILLPVLWANLASCSHSHDSEPREENELYLTIMLQTAPAGSRADELHEEVGSEYTALEEGIDPGDLGIYLFVREKRDGAQEKLLLSIVNMVSSGPGTSELTGGNGQYRIDFKINNKEFEELMSVDSDYDPSSDIEFRIAVLANCSNPESGNLEDISTFQPSTYADFLDQTGQWSYDMNWLYDSEGGDEADALYGNSGHKSGLPMFGTVNATVAKSVLDISSSEQCVNLGEISMLRALAKVRVVDNIQHKTGGYPKIKQVAIRSSRGFARPLPANVATYVNGYQVHTTNPAPNRPAQNSFRYALGTIPDTWNKTPASSRTGDTFIGYLPEQSIYDGTEAKPVFIITIATDWDADGTEELKVYEVPMSSYNGNTFGFGDNILRNHIYTLVVTGLVQEDLFVTARLTPWIYNREHIDI